MASNNSVEETLESAKLTLYPNPVSIELNIDSDKPIQKVEVYNLSGALVNSQQGNSNTVNMSSLSNGSYFVKVHTEGSVTSKIIIKK
jgi:pectate lyase